MRRAPPAEPPAARDPRTTSQQLRDLWGEIRRDLAPRAFPIEGTVSRRLAWAAAGVAFAAGFGQGLYNAVRYLVEREVRTSTMTWQTLPPKLIADTSVVLLLGITTILVCRWLTPSADLGWKGTRREVTAGGSVVLLAYASFAFVRLVSSLFGFEATYPTPEQASAPYLVDRFVSSALAGFREEPLFTILIPVLLRSAGGRWPLVLLAASLLRVSFHVYYGPGALMLVLWGVGTIAVVQRTGCIWGVILFHSLHDILAGLLTWSTSTSVTAVGIGLLCAEFGLVCYAAWRIARHVWDIRKGVITRSVSLLV